MNEAAKIIILFFVYSFFGWVCETFYCSVGKRKFVNRGFLNGPLCPVYGFGALLVVYLLEPFLKFNVFVIFIAGMVATSVLEYITGFLLEKLFHLKWWDYSTYKFNINGRVCLKNSLMFGALSVALTYFIHPFISGIVGRLSFEVSVASAAVLLALTAVDLIVTVRNTLQIKANMENLRDMLEQAKTYSEQLKVYMADSADIKREDVRRSVELIKIKLNNIADKVMAQKSKKLLHRRIISAFPNISSVTEQIKDDIKNRLKQENK